MKVMEANQRFSFKNEFTEKTFLAATFEKTFHDVFPLKIQLYFDRLVCKLNRSMLVRWRFSEIDEVI